MAILRHPTLQPLSRQHHQGLLASLLLEKGLKKNASLKEMRDFIIQFWEEELRLHFEKEDLLFLPLAYKYPQLLEGLTQLKNEHQEIRLIIQKLNNEARSEQYDTIASFANLLEKHIRFEERQLFNAIQEILPEDELIDFTVELQSISEKDFCTKYPVKFWE
ncbi:MAG: hemerythrin domain-containing protein [Bacteroidota bacterium]